MKNAMTYQEILEKFKKYESDPILSNQKLMFMGNGVYATFKVDGKWDQLRQICPIFIPTKKGYISSEWKKNALSKMEFELTEDSYDEISSFIQNEQPNHFTPIYARGVNVANVLANHLKGSDPYDRG